MTQPLLTTGRAHCCSRAAERACRRSGRRGGAPRQQRHCWFRCRARSGREPRRGRIAVLWIMVASISGILTSTDRRAAFALVGSAGGVPGRARLGGLVGACLPPTLQSATVAKADAGSCVYARQATLMICASSGARSTWTAWSVPVLVVPSGSWTTVLGSTCTVPGGDGACLLL